jgi:hypothetical protein
LRVFVGQLAKPIDFTSVADLPAFLAFFPPPFFVSGKHFDNLSKPRKGRPLQWSNWSCTQAARLMNTPRCRRCRCRRRRRRRCCCRRRRRSSSSNSSSCETYTVKSNACRRSALTPCHSLLNQPPLEQRDLARKLLQQRLLFEGGVRPVKRRCAQRFAHKAHSQYGKLRQRCSHQKGGR